MDTLCQPATVILLVSIAGTLYNLLFVSVSSAVWWVMVGLFGTLLFQMLCRGGFEPMAWILMLLPVMVVSFFLAVALFTSRVRITNINRDETYPTRCPMCHSGCPRIQPSPNSCQAVTTCSRCKVPCA